MRQNFNFQQLLHRLPIILILVITSVLVKGTPDAVSAGHANWPTHGMICTENTSSTFTLTTQTGYISLPDGNVAYMWGFSEGNNPFQHPSPVLCVKEGDLVTIVLHNTLGEDVSIIFPGQENVLANGKLAQPVFDAQGNMVSMTDFAPKNGGSITYSFVASKPGTYIYESGTNTGIQVNMGLFGTLVVRPATNTATQTFAYNDPESEYTPDEEFLMLLSEIDPYLHTAVEQGQPFDMNEYHPRYWLINGRGFPDTIAPNGASWLPNQPYSSMGHIYPYSASHPHPALIRYLSVGSDNFPFHPHGNHGRIIARDGNLLRGAQNQDLSYEEFTVNVGPGQTIDALFDWRNIDNYDPTTNPIPVEIPQLQNLVFGQFYSGSPYLGNVDTLPVGTQALNQCGEYYHIAHNHALHQITAWGVVLSGHITFNRIDPPQPNQCP